jgi:hypothetical protein
MLLLTRHPRRPTLRSYGWPCGGWESLHQTRQKKERKNWINTLGGTPAPLSICHLANNSHWVLRMSDVLIHPRGLIIRISKRG